MSTLDDIEEAQTSVRRAALLLSAAATVLKSDDFENYGRDAELRKVAHGLAELAKPPVIAALEVDIEIGGELFRLLSGIIAICNTLAQPSPLSGEGQCICPEVDVLECLAEFAGRDNCEGLNSRLQELGMRLSDVRPDGVRISTLQ